MSVGEICNREVIVMEPRESLVEAARLMREQHVGAVVVVAERGQRRVPVGILSDRDLVVEVLAKEVALDSLAVGDVMSTDLLSVRDSDDVLETIKQMKTRGVRRVPVGDEAGALVGILALDDLIELVAEQLSDLVGVLARELRHERELRSD